MNAGQAHLLARLEIVDLLIRLQVARFRAAHRREDLYRGLYISEDDVDALLRGRPITPTWESAGPPPPAFGERLAACRAAASAAEREARRSGAGAPLLDLAATFGLDDSEVDALLIALAPDIDLRYERLYAYLQDDVTRKRPSVDLVVSLLATRAADRLRCRRWFLPDAPLLRHQLLAIADESAEQPGSALSRAVRVDEAIVRLLVDGRTDDRRLTGVSWLVHRCVAFDNLVIAPGVAAAVNALIRADLPCDWRAAAAPGPLCLLTGRAGSGRKSVAQSVAAARGVALRVVDCERLIQSPASAELVPLLFRQSMVERSALYLDRFEQLLGAEPRAPIRWQFEAALGRHPGLTFVGSDRTWEPSGEADRFVARLRLPDLGQAQRQQLWARHLNGDGTLDAAALGGLYALGGGGIAAAVMGARQRARARGRERPERLDLVEAVRDLSNQKLGNFARRIVPVRTWDDLVLPPDRLELLRSLGNAVRSRSRVLHDWAFERKLTMGKGMAVLFAGPPGTGKTMAAEVIAGDLGLELFRIDMATVVSKYIGETEQNLSRVFAEAQTSNALLLFDEADALFGKRTEVRDSHDRYANLEVSYLLQKMEEYEGVAILATNLRQNLDEAFLRRLFLVVDFPFPDEATREGIWRSMFPAAAPVDADVDFARLGRALPVAGGSIRNIVVGAAFMAAPEGSVRMSHLVRAAQREMQKLGKPWMPADLTLASTEP